MRTLARALWLVGGACLLAPPAYSQPFYHRWSHGFGDTGSDIVRSVAIHGDDNDMIVVGSFTGTVDFGGGPLTSAGESDIFIARFDEAGTHLWSRHFGGSGTDAASHVDISGDAVTVTGAFEETVNFGGSDLTSTGGSDIFIARFNGAGTHGWSVRVGDTGDDAGRSLAVASGETAVTGSYTDPVAGTTNTFVAKYDAAGGEEWSDITDGTSDDTGTSVAFLGTAVVIAGEFGTDTPYLTAGSAALDDSNIFLAKYDGNGVFQWARYYGAATDEGNPVLAIQGSNIYITGYFTSQLSFGGSTLNSAGGKDIFLARLDANGVQVWAKRFGGSGDDVATNVVTGDGIFITGHFQNTAYFGSGYLTSAGSSDIFMAVFDQNGTNWRHVRFGSPGNDAGTVVEPYLLYWPTIDSGEPSLVPGGGYVIALAGSFTNSVNFGGGAITSAGGDDAFLASFGEHWLTPAGPALPSDRLAVASFPNPFNPSTTIRYSLPSSGAVTVSIFDVSGARVATLVSNELRRAGPHEIQWRGRSDDGSGVASGVYFAQVEHAGARQTTRLVMLK